MVARTRAPEYGFSRTTWTPTSIEVWPTKFTDARSRTWSPMWQGARNDIRSMLTVTTLRPQCRWAAIAATMSTHDMIVPPNAIPSSLACWGMIM